MCFFEKIKNSKEEMLHVFSLDSLDGDHSDLPVYDIVNQINERFSESRKTIKKNDKVINVKVNTFCRLKQ